MFCFVFVWCPCIAINVSVQHNGGFLPGIILLTLKEGLYPRWDGMPRERECVGVVQDLLGRESKTHTGLGANGHESSRTNHRSITGMQQNK